MGPWCIPIRPSMYLPQRHRLHKRIADKIQWPEDESGCWIWDACTSGGYGCIHWDGRMQHAMRVVYEELVAPIPTNLVPDHLCRNRMCVNPGHMEIVTHKVNILRGEGTGARFARRTECNHGHEFTKGNTLMRSDGGRRCRTCDNARSRRRRA